MARKVACHGNTRGRGLSPRQLELLEQERRRIAGNLHDGAGQLLNIIKFKLYAMMESNPGGAMQNELEEIDRLIDLTSHQIRSLEYELSPPVLHHFGLVPALGWLADNLKQSYGLEVSVHHDGVESPLDELTSAIVFRAVRELLINVARHAEVKNAKVEIRTVNYMLMAIVTDSGPGFEVEQALGTAATGMGLANVFEQMHLLGGMAEVASAAAIGTIVTLTVPLNVSKTNWRKPAWLFV